MKKIDSIQLLRGISAIFILLYYIRFCAIGHFAVDMFFIISGFIMMYSTNNDKPILLKRVLRIIPLYYLCTFFMFAVIKYFPSLSLMSSAKISYLIKSLFFIPYVSYGVGGSPAVVPIVGIAWTLNLEMYFYLIFTVSNKISHRYRGLITSLVIVLVAVMGLVINTDSLVFKYLTDSVILEFVLGMFIYYVHSKYVNIFKLKANLAYFMWFLIFVLFGFVIYLTKTSNVDVRLISFGIPCAVIFILSLISFKNINIPKWALLPGKVSYSFYFVEFFVSAFVNIIIDKLALSMIFNVIIVILSVFVTLFISYISWYIIEDKLNKFLGSRLKIK